MMSSLALHYIQDLNTKFQKMATALKPGGDLAFSIEHPIFTAEGKEDWIYDENGKIVCWPVDRYFDESLRESIFLGEKVVKYHHPGRADAYSGERSRTCQLFKTSAGDAK